MPTIIYDPSSGGPKNWQNAAQICVSEIFTNVHSVTERLEQEKKHRIVSSAGPDELGENNEELISVLDGIELLDIQFEGMLNSQSFSNSDGMYWVEEWKILGRIAAGAGIKNGNLNFYPELLSPPRHPEMYISSASVPFSGETLFLENDISAILARKQRDYGHHNISRFGRHGLLVRCHDKIARLKNLHLSRAGEAANESLADTYIDIIGYSAIGMMVERGWFLLHLEDEQKLI